jgi:hypothetical protein
VRTEAKVYLSHTDMARLQYAAKRSGLSLSSWMRQTCLVMADEMGAPVMTSLLDRQLSLGYGEVTAERARELVGGE